MGLLYTGKKAYFENANVLAQGLYVFGLTSTLCLGLECARPALLASYAKISSTRYSPLRFDPIAIHSRPSRLPTRCVLLLYSHPPALFMPSLRAQVHFTRPS